MTRNQDPAQRGGMFVAVALIVIVGGIIWMMLTNDPFATVQTAPQPAPTAKVVVIPPPASTGASPGVPQEPGTGQR
jgi:hypothetical protein